MRQFEAFVGIDYSGAERPGDPLGNLRVFVVDGRGNEREVRSRIVRRSNLSREEVRGWLEEQFEADSSLLVGIDHAFSLPKERLASAGIANWEGVLRQFRDVVRTHARTVADARMDPSCSSLIEPPFGEEFTNWFRLTERRVSGAKSALDYNGPGVAFSTMAGISELAVLRERLRERGAGVHFWPFDGFEIPATGSVVVEIYPALCNRQFERQAGVTSDQHDARCSAQWLREIASDGRLTKYLDPPLSAEQRALVAIEGWILGVM